VFDRKIQSVRKHPGQSVVSRNFQKLLKGSQIGRSHKNCPKVQDSYSLRCIPQAHGAIRDAFAYIKQVLLNEINSVTDNPLVFAKTRQVLSGGNFHGHPIALASDFLAISASGLANISERRIESLVSAGDRPSGNSDMSKLPTFLVKDSGFNSGFMLPQVVAASLASENKILSHPASVDTIPTSANQEDFVSMGTTAARKARQVINNLQYIISIELLTAAQGLEFRKPLKPGRGALSAYNTIRKEVKPLLADRSMKDNIETVVSMNDQIIKQVEKEIGELD
jgi:histidine ammonia-lyase